MSQMGHDLTASFTVHTAKSQMPVTFSSFSILMSYMVECKSKTCIVVFSRDIFKCNYE